MDLLALEELKFQYNIAEAMSRDVQDFFMVDVETMTATTIKLGGKLLPKEKRIPRSYIDTWNTYIEKYVHPEDREMLRVYTNVSHLSYLLSKNDEYNCRYRVVVGDQIRNLQVVFTYIGERNSGKIAFGMRCVDDIVNAETERNKSLQEARDIAEARLVEITSLINQLKENSDIIANSGYGIWRICIKPDGQSTMTANDTLQKIFGIDNLNLNGETLYQFYHNRLLEDVDEIESDDYQRMQEGNLKSRVLSWNHPSKGLIYLHAGGTSYVQPDGTQIISGYCGDMTKHRSEIMRLNQELEAAIKQAKAANKAKTNFLFNMSHDIRTPMNAIIGFANLMEKNFDNAEKCKDYLSKIQSSSRFLLSLINNVLEMARIESGKTELKEEVYNTAMLPEEMNMVYSELMKQKSIKFVVESDIKTKTIYCDSVLLKEIVLNLISNSYKYTQKGGTVMFHSSDSPAIQDGYVDLKIVVSDTGIGMSQKFLPTLFDEFSREHTSMGNNIEGTGLGMPIVKKLVELMGGNISVESQLGKGSTFTVVIPVKISDEPMLEIQAESMVNTDYFIGKHILLAEDNDLNAEIAIELLSQYGLIVDRARDGIECLDMLTSEKQGTYSAILMDVQMPNMDGYKATKIIRANPLNADLPIIAMTANAFEEDKRAASASGMNGHLAKPIDVDLLLDTLARLIR